MDLKKLKKQSSTLAKKIAGTHLGVLKVENIAAGISEKAIKSTLKIDSYTSKYKKESNLYQDFNGSKKLDTSKWTLKTQTGEGEENIDESADEKLGFYDEHGEKVAEQG